MDEQTQPTQPNLQEIVAAVMAAMEAKRPPARPRRSESITELVKALSQARPKIKSILDASQEARMKPKDPSKKEWSFNYDDLPEILEAIYPFISEHGLEAIGTIHRSNSGPILVVELHHAESGQWVGSEFQLKECADQKDFLGQVTSYRRVALKALLNLASRKPENTSNNNSNGTHMVSASYSGTPPKRQPPPNTNGNGNGKPTTATPKSGPGAFPQRPVITKTQNQLRINTKDIEQLIVDHELPPIDEMTPDQGSSLIELMEKFVIAREAGATK